MSILLDLHQNDNMNNHLQKAISEWQKQYDINEAKCTKNSKRDLFKREEFEGQENDIHGNSTLSKRDLQDETPFGRGGWDPFHPSLERTIYFWGYWGTLTEPPCSTFVSWRGEYEYKFLFLIVCYDFSRSMFLFSISLD